MRLEGQQQFVTNTTLAGGSTRAMTYWDASISVCLNCSANGTLYVNGTGNQIQLTSGVDPNALLSVIDNGIGNVVTGQHADNPPDGDIPTRLTAIGTPFRGGPPVESRSNDFLLTGLSSAPYFNNYDLFLAPEDLGFTGGDHPSIVLDHSSFTGRYVALKSGGSTGCIALFNATTHPCKMEIGESLAGANVPAASVNVYVMAKCPAITSYTFAVRANRTIVNSGTFTCSTNYTVQSISANLSSHGGNDLGFAWSTGEVDIAYVAVVPYFGNLYSSRSEYWNIQPGLFAENKALGPVYYYVAPSAIVSVTARLSGPISCSDAPAVTIIDLGISPTTNFESAKVLKTLPTGTADGVFSATGFSAAIMGGHYVGLGFSAGTCATPPTIDVTITVQ
jgi:hypothetical protein